MKMKRVFGAVVAAVGLTASAPAAHAITVATVSMQASFNGGAAVALTDSDPAPDSALFFGAIGTFVINLDSGIGVPSSLPNLLQVTASDNHTGSTTDTLDLYITSVGNDAPVGLANFLSQFTSNAFGVGLSLAESTYLDALNRPFFLTTLLGNALFPPLLLTGADSMVANTGGGLYSLTALLHITATGTQASTATVAISAVPGPIVGAGLPGLIAACGGLLALARRRRKAALA